MEAVSCEELAAKRAAKKAAFNTEYDAGVARPRGLRRMSPLSPWCPQSMASTFLHGCSGLALTLHQRHQDTRSPWSGCSRACANARHQLQHVQLSTQRS